jgi:xanthine dehydrogenase iron-sulfur cluster and FAD-binding subunit A
MWKKYINAAHLDEAIDALALYGKSARVIAGATDIMLELERGVRPGVSVLIDISRADGLNQIRVDSENNIHLGPLVTHNDCAASNTIQQLAYPLARACWEVGSPQIRNRGTVVGNLVTASPANDTITPLMALGARMVLKSKTGERSIPLAEFYTGVRKNVMRADELVAEVVLPPLRLNQSGHFIKYALRNAQAISLVNIAVILSFSPDGRIEKAQITLGAVAPTIIHAPNAEAFLPGRFLDEEVIRSAGDLVMGDVRPIDDLRGSARYRKVISGVIARRALTAIWNGQEKAGMPEHPILLRSSSSQAVLERSVSHDAGEEIVTCINGVERRFQSGQEKSLLRLLREEGVLVGTKEGCTEGECGACTVHLDGAAVMSCMVPAPRAHGAIIQTVEGLAADGKLHPIQDAFIQEGAVQCGYCTPGFLMSGAMLLRERKHPTVEDIKQAFTGNLCRCTGYYKIIKAVETAVREGG